MVAAASCEAFSDQNSMVNGNFPLDAAHSSRSSDRQKKEGILTNQTLLLIQLLFPKIVTHKNASNLISSTLFTKPQSCW